MRFGAWQRVLTAVGIAVVAAGLTPVAGAEVRIPAIFGSSMALQHSRSNPIWGWASPGEKVTVVLDGREVRTTAGENGRWTARLPRLAAGGPYTMTVTGDDSPGSNRITLDNIMAGEVWICSGQSNMDWPVRLSTNGEEEVRSARHPRLRLFMVRHATASQPSPDLEGKWVECSPETVPDFSGVAYFFGREMLRDRGIPVGLIKTAYGGTPVESWMSREALEADPDHEPIATRWQSRVAFQPYYDARHRRQLVEWEINTKAAKAAGKPDPDRPWGPSTPETDPWRPSSLYNAMIAPLVPFGIRGAIWYQGESNADRAYQYRRLFPSMIRDWRSAWGQGDFPFLFVQLANFLPVKPEPGEDTWAELREAQERTLSLPRTWMATAIDIGEAADIHPKNKQDVGKRLYWAAKRVAYGEDGLKNPRFNAVSFGHRKARVRFAAKGRLVTKDGAAVRGFAVAGKDRRFHRADAVIDGADVLLRCPAVTRPVAVRYAWAINPDVNLADESGLPVLPFRTDDWPGVTANNR